MQIEGTCDEAEVVALKAAVNIGQDYDRFHCLCNTGASLCGIGDWASRSMSQTGNLAERDYSVKDVADTLETLLAAAPSLKLKVHCGGEREDKTVINTITVADGAVTIGPPEKGLLPERSEADMTGRFLNAILEARRI